MKFSFFVPGVPVPKGSAKAFVNKRTGRAQVMQDNREKQIPWASAIHYSAQQKKIQITTQPVILHLFFAMPRPRHHYGSGSKSTTVKLSAPNFHTKKPDLDKLIRCVKDALTGVVWMDDSQCYEVFAKKHYADTPGVQICVEVVQP